MAVPSFSLVYCIHILALAERFISRNERRCFGQFDLT